MSLYADNIFGMPAPVNGVGSPVNGGNHPGDFAPAQKIQDPVKTLHGQIYERAAIEDWLKSKSTDPMTGETLKIKALFPDDEMNLRCAEYVLGLKPPVTRLCGRGGRGGGGGRGGRGERVAM